MKNKTLFIATIFAPFLLANSAIATANESYQYEVLGGYTRLSSDSEAEFQDYHTGIAAYLTPAEYDGFPYAEADFISRTPIFSAIVGRAEGDFLGSTLAGPTATAFVGLKHQDIPVFANVIYEYLSLGATINSSEFDMTVSGAGVELGYYFDQTTALKLGYMSMNLEASVDDDSFTSDATQMMVQVKKIVALSSSGFVDFEFAYVRESVEDEFVGSGGEFGVTYYLNRSIGIGGVIGAEFNDDNEKVTTEYGVSMSSYFARSLNVSLEYRITTYDDIDGDSQELGLIAAYRF